ncbi:MAG: hypothetical protein ACPGUF_03140 [Litorivicinus sp.]
MTLFFLALAWLCLPRRWDRVSAPTLATAAVLPVAVWPLLAAGVVLLRRWLRVRQAARAARAIANAAPDWVALLALYAPITGNLASAVNRASAAWAARHPSLDCALGHAALTDLDHRCAALSDPSRFGPLVAQVAAGLDRMRHQGADTAGWLAQLQEQHDMAQAEKVQARAAALGSKLLVPLVLGALPQAFLIIGFVTLQGDGI